MMTLILKSFGDELEKLAQGELPILTSPEVPFGITRAEEYIYQQAKKLNKKYPWINPADELHGAVTRRLEESVARSDPTSRMAEALRSGRITGEHSDMAVRTERGKLVYPFRKETRILPELSEAEAYARSRARAGGVLSSLKELISDKMAFRRLLRVLKGR